MTCKFKAERISTTFKPMPTRMIYLDHAATTPLDPQVLEAMLPYLSEHYGNPSSIYRAGRTTRMALDQARDQVAALIGAESQAEIIFTSGGSEAANLALKGTAWAGRTNRNHLVISAIEHKAVLDSATFLASQGFRVEWVQPDAEGLIHPERVAEVVTDQTLLVSVMHANNEVGTIQDVAAIAEVAHRYGALFHTDAVQTVGTLPVDVKALGCDLLSFSAHKFYGPKGIGALYVRRGTVLTPLVHGGGQERERRGGTENVAGVVGLAKALELALKDRAQTAAYVETLRDRLVQSMLQAGVGAQLNGHRTRRLPGNANFRFPGVDGESLLLKLDMRGIAASSGSACTSGSLEPSHVLLAMGVPRAQAMASLRLTLGRDNTVAEVDRAVDIVREIVQDMQARPRGSAH